MLNRLAVRLCAVQALMGKTFADDGIADSAIVPIEAGAEGKSRPYVAVYTDDQSADGLILTIEIGVTAAMTTEDEAGNKVMVVGVPPTDAGIEMTIDMIERQVHVALADDQNPWAQLFRKIFSESGKPESVRGASVEKGERFAGRQIKITGKPLADPPYGDEPRAGSFWADLLTALDGAAPETGLANKGELFRGLLGVGSAPTSWVLVQRALQATAAETRALGEGPAIGTAAPPIDAEAIELDDGTVTP